MRSEAPVPWRAARFGALTARGMRRPAAARARRRWAHGGCVAVLALWLAACASFEVRPALARNYEWVELAPEELPVEAIGWRTKLQLADFHCDRTRRELEQSTDGCVAAWHEGMRPLAGKPALEQASEVNRLVNQLVVQRPDSPLEGGGDHWDAPLHTLHRGGDCEDLALLKRESLLALGWPEQRLAIVVGTSVRSHPDSAHVVLLVTLEGGAQLLLDSAEADVMPPRDNSNFTPDYAMTRTHVYRVKPWRRHWWGD